MRTSSKGSARLRLAVSTALLAVAGLLAAQAPQFAAGPAYTSGDGMSGPTWPVIDVVLRNVQVTSAAQVHLLKNGADTGPATELRTFADGGYGIEAVMALDASGSMKGRPMAMLRSSLAKFVGEARSQDKVAIVTFADDTRWDVPFGTPPAQISQALQRMQGRGRLTRIYDSLFECLDRYDGTLARRELIVISDGHDEGSAHTLDEVIAKARRLDVPIDAIGVTRSDVAYLKNLEQLAQGTGGSFRAAHSDAELQAMVGNGIGMLKAQPLARFSLEGTARDGSTHAVTVKVMGSGQTAELAITAPADADPATGSSSVQGASVAKAAGHAPGFSVDKRLWWILGASGALLLAIVGLAVLLMTRRKGGQATPVPAEFFPHPQPPAQHPPMPQGQFPAAQPQRQPAWPQPATPPSQPAPTAMEPSWGTPALNVLLDPVHDVLPPTRPIDAALDVISPSPQVSVEAAAMPRENTRMVKFFHAAPGEPFARLDITGGPLQGRALEVRAHTLRVGSAPDNDLPIEADRSVSGHHAAFVLENNIWMVEDLHSTNGTFVNGVRLRGERRALAPGDEIRMGRCAFRVERSGQDASAASSLGGPRE